MEIIVSHHDKAIAKLHARNLDESFLPNLAEKEEWTSLITYMDWTFEEVLAMKKLGRNDEAKLISVVAYSHSDMPDSASSKNSSEFSIVDIAPRNSSVKKHSNSSFQNSHDIKPFSASSGQLALAATKLPLFKNENSTNSLATVLIDRIMRSRSVTARSGQIFRALDYTKNKNLVAAKGNSTSRHHLEFTAGHILETIELNLKGNKSNIFFDVNIIEPPPRLPRVQVLVYLHSGEVGVASHNEVSVPESI
jgi:hypothetical protein